MPVIGKHIIADMHDIAWIPSLDELESIVVEAAKSAGMHVVSTAKFLEGKPGDEFYGPSVIVIVVESHIAVHIWASYRFATVDVYTCGEKSDPYRAFAYILSVLKPGKVEMYYLNRSSDKKLCPMRMSWMHRYTDAKTVTGGCE